MLSRDRSQKSGVDPRRLVGALPDQIPSGSRAQGGQERRIQVEAHHGDGQRCQQLDTGVVSGGSDRSDAHQASSVANNTIT